MANKAELIEQVAKATDLTKKDATAAVEAVFSTIQDALANGEKESVSDHVLLTHKLSNSKTAFKR